MRVYVSLLLFIGVLTGYSCIWAIQGRDKCRPGEVPPKAGLQDEKDYKRELH